PMSYDDSSWPRSARRGPQSPSALGPLLILLAVVALVVGGLSLYRYFRPGDYPGRDVDAAAPPITPRGSLMEIEQTNIRIYKDNKPSVVHITTMVLRSNLFSKTAEVPEGTGSGFFWDEKGHIVTNFHVVRGANAAQVALGDGSTYRADLVGTAEDKDLAVL